ncbi:WhiB family transcriptional regulator [Streptomyces sp. NPDC085612]|uniref:WhiB family transcriptional regulator n=1 Tax=Streptomyces sp. NPDC085612 TaxID=3365732 RepID=UPI0037D07934
MTDPTADWHELAVCAQTDPDVFFPERGEADKTRAAKQVCLGCEVRKQCLVDALDREGDLAATHRFGVWGGYSPRERSRIAARSTTALGAAA